MDDTRREGRKASFLSFVVVGVMAVFQIFGTISEFFSDSVSVWE